MPPLFNNKVHRTAPAGLSKVQVDRLRAGDGLIEIPWYKDGYMTHVDHFAGKNGVHADAVPTVDHGAGAVSSLVMNVYWLLSPHITETQGIGLDGLRPTDAGTVVRICGGVAKSQQESPGFIWSFLNQYRYATLHAWIARLYPLQRGTIQGGDIHSRFFHGLMEGTPADAYNNAAGLAELDQAVTPFVWTAPVKAAQNCIGFTYDYVADPDYWHILIRNGANVTNVATTIAFSLCQWYNFLITKTTNGDLYFWVDIEDGNGFQVVHVEVNTSTSIPTDFMAELHYSDAGDNDNNDDDSCTVIDVSAIVCENDDTTLCQQQ